MSATTGTPPVTAGDPNGAGAPSAILPASKQTLWTVALTARIVLLPAAVLALIAAFTDRPMEGGLVEAGTVIAALTVAALAGVSLAVAQPRLDFGAVAAAMLLAGGEAIQGFGLVGGQYYSHAYALPILAWLGLFAGAVALALTIPLGPGDGSPGLRQAFDGVLGQPGYGPIGSINLQQGSRQQAPQQQQTSGQQAAPGWYPSPDDSTTARWWDGKAWTEHRRDLSEGAT